MSEKLLVINNLKTNFKDKKSTLEAIRDISFSIDIGGSSLGIVGESGSGKSVTMKSVMNILPSNGYVSEGEILFENKNLLTLSNSDLKVIKGNEIAMIFQDPMTSLNPVKTIGYHLIEVILRHNNISKKEATDRAILLLKQVEIPNPEKRLSEYPHQFSGGMRQRVMIAMALANNPKLLIADEPTTALDVTIQSQILRLLKKLQSENQMSIILITHDLAVVYAMCDEIIVMYGGKIMEQGLRQEIFNSPCHPYTLALLRAVPKLNINNDEKLLPIDGVAPSLKNMPTGCPFAPRCEYKIDICEKEFPNITDISPTHKVYCHCNEEVCLNAK